MQNRDRPDLSLEKKQVCPRLVRLTNERDKQLQVAAKAKGIFLESTESNKLPTQKNGRVEIII